MKIKNKKETEVAQVGMSTSIQNDQLIKGNRIQSVPRMGYKLRDKELRFGLTALKREISQCCTREITQSGDNTRQQEMMIQEDKVMKRILPPLRDYQTIKDQYNYIEADHTMQNINLKRNNNEIANKCKIGENNIYGRQQQVIKNTIITSTTNNNSRDESLIEQKQRNYKQNEQLRNIDQYYDQFYLPTSLSKSQSEKQYLQVNQKNQLNNQVQTLNYIKGMNQQINSSYTLEDQQSFQKNNEFSDQYLRFPKLNQRYKQAIKTHNDYNEEISYQQQQDLKYQQNQSLDNSSLQNITEDTQNLSLQAQKSQKQYYYNKQQKQQLQIINYMDSSNQPNDQISSSQKVYLAIKEQQQLSQILKYSSLEKQQKQINQRIKLKQFKLDQIINSFKNTNQILPPQIQPCLYPSLPVRISSPRIQQNVKQQSIENNNFLQLRSYFSNKYEQHKIKQSPYYSQDQQFLNNDSFILSQETKTTPNNCQLDITKLGIIKKTDKDINKHSATKRQMNRVTQIPCEQIIPNSTEQKSQDEIIPWENNLDEQSQGEDDNIIKSTENITSS